MNPWDLLGWLLVAFVGLIVVFTVGRLLVLGFLWSRKRVRDYLRWFKTRNAPFELGQRWYDPSRNYTYRISSVYDTHVSISSGNAGWGEKPDDFRTRIRKQRLYLENA